MIAFPKIVVVVATAIAVVVSNVIVAVVCNSTNRDSAFNPKRKVERISLHFLILKKSRDKRLAVMLGVFDY